MFYGAFVLSKKGPLAKVWLAAHWDKKLTKAQVFETNVESTVDSIISPQVKMALRTSGHLLLGVVRIYSRKQKYLIHDLGEACAKIKMAFRPGIVDLPPESRVDNAEAITLPEIFHDFETAVADLGSLDVEAQFTVNPSRASEITMAEDVSASRANMFSDFGDFDLVGGEFGGGMEDIEVARDAKNDMLEGDTTERTALQVSEMTGGNTLLDENGRGDAITLQDRLPGLNDEFGGGGLMEDGFGLGDGGMMDLGELPNVSDLTLDKQASRDADSKEREDEADRDTPMDVDKTVGDEQPSVGGADQTIGVPDAAPPPEEEGFVLAPLDTTGVEKKTKPTRKRRLVVDSDKEFSGQMIRSQFEDFKDTLQPKCFPPPTKKAMMWKEMANCDQLFNRPTSVLAKKLSKLIVKNYTMEMPGELPADALIDLELDNLETTKDTTEAIETPRNKTEPAVNGDTTAGEVTLPDGSVSRDMAEPILGEFEFNMGADRPGDLEGGLLEGVVEGDGDDGTSRVIPEMPDIEGIAESTEEQQSNELSEEYEQRRWTKRTQQVIRVLDRNFQNKDEIEFSSLTQRCTRKVAASRFYTCLLLAKEKIVTLKQDEPYAEIAIEKGSKFTEAF